MKHITLSDIAKKAGCSVNTVSHALHDKPDISEETKIRIREIADCLGYVGNLSASYLRSGKSKTAAVIVGDISNPHFSIMIKEIEKVLRKKDYSVFILNTDENPQTERKAIEMAAAKNVDGIIICPTQRTRDNIEYLKTLEIPYVLLGRHFDNKADDFVICDDENGGFLAARQLLKEGRKKILFLNGDMTISSAVERRNGILRAFFELDSDLPRLVEVEVPSVSSLSTEYVNNVLSAHMDCDGIIAFNDLIAMHVYYCAVKLGCKIPSDMSIIGFDNICSKFHMPICMSSVSSSKTKMSEISAGILLDKIENSAFPTQNIYLPATLVLRDTTK